MTSDMLARATPLSVRMLIGGQLIGSEATIAVRNPATGDVFATAPDCSKDQLDAAVQAARAAFPEWRARPYAERQKAVAAIATVLSENLDTLKTLLTCEQGKPLPDAMGDILSGAQWCQGTATLEQPIHTFDEGPQRSGRVTRVPLGVVGAISPWNFPVALAMFKIAPALLAGNTVVLKPSPYTPLTTLRIGELLKEHFPPGVLNVISGGDALGPWMTSHPDIDKITFTGSTQTGRRVMASGAPTLKRITLELGGNDPAIVLPDIDPKKLAPRIFWAAFRNNGQFCIATKRLYIHQDIYDDLKSALIAYAATVRIGNGLEDGVQLGPMQNPAQKAHVERLIAEARAEGILCETVGTVPQTDGTFLPLTFLDNPPDSCRAVREEQFGPVLPLLKFQSTEEAITRANACEYGLGAIVWSSDEAAALSVADRLEAGTVWINDCHYLSPLAPFAGLKQSGLGCEGGLEGLQEFSAPRTTFIRRASKR